MGYEVTMYIGEISTFENEGKHYFSIIGMVELSKPGYSSEIYQMSSNKSPGFHEIYFYGTDGNKQITEDDYGNTLKVLLPRRVLQALKRDNANDPYRRFELAIALLERSILNFGNELNVVLYGH